MMIEVSIPLLGGTNMMETARGPGVVHTWSEIGTF
jgi:hypothetical protein